MNTPTHLVDCTAITKRDTVKNYLKADIVCRKNGSKRFEVLLVSSTRETRNRIIPVVLQNDQGFFLVIAIKFLNCDEQFVLLDKDLHGWNGWVFRDHEQLKKTKPPYKLWTCLNCGETIHTGSLEIFSTGKEDFIDQKSSFYGKKCFDSNL